MWLVLYHLRWLMACITQRKSPISTEMLSNTVVMKVLNSVEKNHCPVQLMEHLIKLLQHVTVSAFIIFPPQPSTPSSQRDLLCDRQSCWWRLSGLWIWKFDWIQGSLWIYPETKVCVISLKLHLGDMNCATVLPSHLLAFIAMCTINTWIIFALGRKKKQTFFLNTSNVFRFW